MLTSLLVLWVVFVLWLTLFSTPAQKEKFLIYAWLAMIVMTIAAPALI